MNVESVTFIPTTTAIPGTNYSLNSAICRRKRDTVSRWMRKSNKPGNKISFVMSVPPQGSEEDFAILEKDIREYLESCPEVDSSPLAYVNLGKAGRTDLISRIMSFGGYIHVSTRLDIPVDESQFIPPAPVFDPNQESVFEKFDTGASLSLGRDLEAKLESLDQLSRTSGDASNSRTMTAPEGKDRDDVPSGEEIRRENERILPPVVDAVVPEGERVVLTAGMRFGMVLLAVLFAIGFGRSSSGVISEDAIVVCRAIASTLGVTHLFVAVYAGFWLAPRLKRNPTVWSLKVLLGGPLGFRYLRSLKSL